MVKGMGKGPAHDVLQVLHLLRWSTHTHTPCHEKKAGYEVATPTQARQGQRGTPRRPNPQVHEKRTREEGNQGDPKITTEPFHYHEHVQVGLKARGPAVFKLDS